MKQKIILSIFFVIVLSLNVSAEEIEIFNCEDIQNIPRLSSESYVLHSDIDCSMTKNLNNGLGFKPLDSFRGIFDGNGYSIRNLNINRPNEKNIGLFGVFTNSHPNQNAKIVDLKVFGNITGKDSVGGIIGMNEGGLIENLYFEGTVIGEKNVGGLVGRNSGEGTILSSSSSGSVIAWEESEAIGGLVGSNVGNAIVNSSSNSFVMGDRVVGGLIGYNTGRIVSHCNYDGTVLANGWLGGIIGTNKDSGPTNPSGLRFGGTAFPNYPHTGIVQNCYSSGKIGSPDVDSIYVGGLIGLNEGGNISNSFSDSFIMGKAGIGGLIGGHIGFIENSYFSGDVSGAYFIGGLVGINGNETLNGAIKKSYFNGGIWSFNQQVLGQKVAGTITGNNDGGLIEDSYYYKTDSLYSDKCYAFDCEAKKGEGQCNSFGETGCIGILSKDYFNIKDNLPIKDWDFVNIWEIENSKIVLRDYKENSVDIEGVEVEYTPNVQISTIKSNDQTFGKGFFSLSPIVIGVIILFIILIFLVIIIRSHKNSNKINTS